MTVRLKIEVLSEFVAPKEGEALEEREDRHAHDHSRSDKYVAAVSDGASRTAYSAQWAECLAERFMEAPTESIDSEWLSPAVRKFTSDLHYDQMPWYTLVKISRGACATLIGLVIDLREAMFSAVSVGDSCLAWQNEQEDRTFPMTSAEEFATPPYLICHLPERNTRLTETQQGLPGRSLPDGCTYFFLMTDALAAWYLRERSEGHSPWQQLLQLQTDGFQNWLQGLRSSGQIRDDDVTLIALRVQVDRSVNNDALPVSIGLPGSGSES